MLRELGAEEASWLRGPGLEQGRQEQERSAAEKKAWRDGTLGGQRVDGCVWSAGNARREEN